MKQLLIILLVLCSITFAKAQNTPGSKEEENEDALIKHSPQHGGQIVDAGKYKLEVLVNPMQKEDKLVVYVLKKNYKTMVLTEGSAKLFLRYKDGKTDTLTLQLNNGRFTSMDIDLSLPVNIIFQIQAGTKTIAATYFYEGLNKR